MSFEGTARYASLQTAVPHRVRDAVLAARSIGFDLCVHPSTGRLLQVLAAGLAAGARVGEAGTGTGAGLAWMTSMASSDVSFVSVECDEQRATTAQDLFADMPNVEVVHSDAGELYSRDPFDLLVLDGGWGSGKTGDRRVELPDVVKQYGVFTVDDFSPMTAWPPMFQDAVDAGRHHWLTHPDVLATEIQVAPDMAVLVGRYTPGAHAA